MFKTLIAVTAQASLCAAVSIDSTVDIKDIQLFKLEGCLGYYVSINRTFNIGELVSMNLDDLAVHGYLNDTAKSVIVPEGLTLYAYSDDLRVGVEETIVGTGTCVDLTTTKNSLSSLMVVKLK